MWSAWNRDVKRSSNFRSSDHIFEFGFVFQPFDIRFQPTLIRCRPFCLDSAGALWSHGDIALWDVISLPPAINSSGAACLPTPLLASLPAYSHTAHLLWIRLRAAARPFVAESYNFQPGSEHDSISSTADSEGRADIRPDSFWTQIDQPAGCPPSPFLWALHPSPEIGGKFWLLDWSAMPTAMWPCQPQTEPSSGIALNGYITIHCVVTANLGRHHSLVWMPCAYPAVRSILGLVHVVDWNMWTSVVQVRCALGRWAAEPEHRPTIRPSIKTTTVGDRPIFTYVDKWSLNLIRILAVEVRI